MKALSPKLFAMMIALLGVGVLVVNLVLAHPSLVGQDSSPQPGTLIDVSPERITVVFTVESVEGGLQADGSLFWLVQQTGRKALAIGRVDLDNADRNTMVAALEAPLEPGLYTVKWVGLSAEGGFSEGDYDFAIQGEPSGTDGHQDS